MLEPSPGRRRGLKESARQRFADLFGVEPNEVGFLYSTSDGENVVARGMGLRPGDNVVVDELHFTTSFVHGRKPEDVAALFKRERIVVSLRERGTQVRAGVAMFNNRADVRRFLEVLATIA